MAEVAEVNKSQAIRDYLKKNKKAMPLDVVAALKEQGIEVTAGMVSNVKLRMSKGKPGRRKTRTVEVKAAKKGRPKKAKLERGGKAQAIRDTFEVVGKDARPVDVIATLAARGITVSSAQVTTIRQELGGKRRGRRKSKIARQVVQPSTNGVAMLSIDHLVAAQKLAKQVGGIDVAKKALEALSKLG
jgi:hypothetical protein